MSPLFKTKIITIFAILILVKGSFTLDIAEVTIGAEDGMGESEEKPVREGEIQQVLVFISVVLLLRMFEGAPYILGCHLDISNSSDDGWVLCQWSHAIEVVQHHCISLESKEHF